MKNTVHRLALCSLLVAVCFALSYVELMIPLFNFGLPGIKAGLANICVIYALFELGAKEAAGINFIRVVLNWLIFGSFTGMLYSVCGALLSMIAMILLKRAEVFSPIGVSAGGGACHNLGQLICAAALTDFRAAYSYLPLLLISGVLTGALNGFIFTLIRRAKGLI